jgi:hypothetical protein
MQQDTPATAKETNEIFWTRGWIIGLMSFMILFGVKWAFVGSLALPVALTLIFLDQWWMGRPVRLVYWLLALSLGFFAFWWLTTPHVATFSAGVVIDNIWAQWIISSALGLLVVFLLTRTLDRSIREFEQSGASQKETKFLFDAGFFIGILLVSFLIGRGADLITRQLGACYFPTLPDLAQQWQDKHRQGIGIAVMRTSDLGCDRNFRYQDHGPQEDMWMGEVTAMDVYMRRIDVGAYNEELGRMGELDIDHHLSVYQTVPDLEEFARILGRAGTRVQIPDLRTRPDFAGMACEKDEEYAFFDCRVIIVRGPVVSHLWFFGQSFPDDQVLELANPVILETDERVLQYLAANP